MTSGKGSGAGKAAGKAAAGILKPVFAGLRKARVLPGSSTNAVKALYVGTYADLKKIEKVGDNLEHDHIPSSAALIKAEETRLGRTLTRQEQRQIRDSGTTIEVPKGVHAQSDTFRGKNTQTQISSDASNLGAAANRDYATTRANLIAAGHSAQDVDAALDRARAMNKAKGIV